MRRVRHARFARPRPATIRSGPSSCVTASIWAGFSSSRIRWAAGSDDSGTARDRGESDRDTPDLGARHRPAQASAGHADPGYPHGPAAPRGYLDQGGADVSGRRRA
jgi:hypothetical protein